MKRMMFLLIPLWAFVLSSAQVPFELSKSVVFRDKMKERAFGIEAIGHDGEYVYFLHKPYNAVYVEKTVIGGETYHIAKHGHDLNLVKREPVNLRNEDKPMEFESMQMIGGKLILITSFRNDKQKKHYLLMREISRETLQGEGEIKVIGTLDYAGYSKYHHTSLRTEISEDGSKVLVFFTFMTKNSEVLKFGMYVYDDNFSLLWDDENVTPKNPDGVFSYLDFKVDNGGNVFLLGKHYKDRGNYFDEGAFKKIGASYRETFYTDKPNYIYQVYWYNEKGREMGYANLNLEGKFIRSLNFEPGDNGSICCYGIYASKGTISAKGSFIFNYDIVNKAQTGLAVNPFSELFVKQAFNEKEMDRFRRSMKNKEETDPYDYLVSGLKTRSTGERYFVAEQFLEGEREDYSGKTIYISSMYLYNDLIVIQIPSGNGAVRTSRITRQQYALTTSRYNSYHMTEVDGKLYFLFNNIIRAKKFYRKAGMGNTLLVSLDQAGSQEKSVVKQDFGTKSQVMLPGTAVSVDAATVIYGAMSFLNKDYAYEKLILKE